MILVRRELEAERLDLVDSHATEIILVKIPARKLLSRNDLYLLAVYIPPDPLKIPIDIHYTVNLMERLHSMDPDSHFLVLGDFNLPCIKWDRNGPHHTKHGSVDVQNDGIFLTESLSFLSLNQYNILKNHTGNTLDLAFSD